MQPEPIMGIHCKFIFLRSSDIVPQSRWRSLYKLRSNVRRWNLTMYYGFEVIIILKCPTAKEHVMTILTYAKASKQTTWNTMASWSLICIPLTPQIPCIHMSEIRKQIEQCCCKHIKYSINMHAADTFIDVFFSVSTRQYKGIVS